MFYEIAQGNNKTNLANKESNFWTTNKQLKRKLCYL